MHPATSMIAELSRGARRDFDLTAMSPPWSAASVLPDSSTALGMA